MTGPAGQAKSHSPHPTEYLVDDTIVSVLSLPVSFLPIKAFFAFMFAILPMPDNCNEDMPQFWWQGKYSREILAEEMKWNS